MSGSWCYKCDLPRTAAMGNPACNCCSCGHGSRGERAHEWCGVPVEPFEQRKRTEPVYFSPEAARDIEQVHGIKMKEPRKITVDLDRLAHFIGSLMNCHVHPAQIEQIFQDYPLHRSLPKYLFEYGEDIAERFQVD